MNIKSKELDHSSFQSEWNQVRRKTKNSLKPYFFIHHMKENTSKIAFLALILAFQWPVFGQNLELWRFRVLDSLLLINMFFSQLMRISWEFFIH